MRSTLMICLMLGTILGVDGTAVYVLLTSLNAALAAGLR